MDKPKSLRVTASALHLREHPRPDALSLGTLPRGETVSPLVRVDDWVPVRTADGRVGYVHDSYVEEVESATTPAPPPAVKPGGWRLARALKELETQINQRAPKRKKTHDGTIGDAAHSARASDHNPNKARVVTAEDFTHDPAGGCDCEKLAALLVKNRDRRIKYMIWNSRIVRSYDKPGLPAWVWTKYTGANKHDKHIHVSVSAEPALYDDPSPWNLA